MGSNYYGDDLRGTSTSSTTTSSSSRKGKKGNSDKPKQPQRGLGVAQLEKIRLNSQLGCAYLPNPYSSSPNFNQEDYNRLQTPYPSSSSPTYGFQGHHHHGVMMGLSDLDKSNTIAYGGDSQTSGGGGVVANARWHTSDAPTTYANPHYNVDPRITRSFFDSEIEDSYNKKTMKDRQDLMMGMGSQNSESCNSEDIDLELKLSL